MAATRSRSPARWHRTPPIDDWTGAVRVTDEIQLLPRHAFRLAIVPDPSGSLIVATFAPADRFEEFRPRAEAIIESLEFVEP